MSRCNYDYDVMKQVILAMESRLVDHKQRTLDESKLVITDLYAMIQIMSTDKTLTQELRQEGKAALERGNKNEK